MNPLANEIDGPITVIGDVHGQVTLLESLLARLRRRADFDRRWIVFIGDFLDRGPDPRAALEAVLKLQREHSKVTAVCGNHDFACAAALGLIETPAKNNWPDRYLTFYDARSTFASYDVTFGDLPALRQAMPESHREFIARLPWAVFHPSYLMVHAGLLPGRQFAEQANALRAPDASLNAPPWLCDRNIARAPLPADCLLTVVSGHVPVPEVKFSDRRVLVDSTGGNGGELSAVLLPEGKVITSGDPSLTLRHNRNSEERQRPKGRK